MTVLSSNTLSNATFTATNCQKIGAHKLFPMEMASSPVHHDVFISFSGEDTRDGFVSHLLEALGRKKIVAFVDDRVESRNEISPELEHAVEGSKLSLIVFSESYAFSKSRLDEVIKILECRRSGRQLVVPIFYRVDPSAVRKQTGSFGEAFAELEKEITEMDGLKKWKDALTETANLSGWDSSVVRPDSLLVEEIARDVLKKLNFLSLKANAMASATISKKLVGIDSRAGKIVSLLSIGLQNFLMVGVWGMGGIGKTTLAEAVYNRISHDYDVSYFFGNVRDAEEKGELLSLRDKFLSNLLGGDHLHLGAPDFQPDFVKRRLRRKRVLIVLDDVTESGQLETLLGELDGFGGGSRAIVTTRDKQILESFNVAKYIYNVEKLNEDESSQLLCQYCFPQDHPTESYNELVKKVVDYAQGVPLALKVLGSSLRGKEKQLWQSALKKLKRIPNLKILDVLKISYDSLDDEETKEMFLDIACFFKGKDLDDVVSILDRCYDSIFSGIAVLIDKSLISIMGNRIEMHDLLQELCWDIVRQESKAEPGKRSRLWTPEDVRHVLWRNTGTDTIKGITVALSKMKAVNISRDAFEKMYNLRFLKFYGATGVSDKIYPLHGLKSLPDELRYLCWNGYPLKSLPSSFHMETLVELDLGYSNLHQLWSGTQNFVNLKTLNVVESKKLREIPDLSRATNLERLHLSGCKSLVRLPPSIKHLQNLTVFELTGCKRLKCLPSNITLRSLVTLGLTRCSEINKFPEISRNLQELNMCGTAIEEVPSSIKQLSRLVVLRLSNCGRLEKLPDSLRDLDSLQTLDLRGCRNIRMLPEFSEKLKHLLLEETAIEEIPSSIGYLPELFNVALHGCKSLKTLPKSIWKLKSLGRLFLSGCSKLEEIPEVPEEVEGLSDIDLSGTCIKDLPPSIERVVGLESFSLNDCQNISTLPDALWNLKSLRDFRALRTCLKQLPNFSMDLKDLEYLHISGCDSRGPLPLQVPPLSNVRYLNSLRLRDLHIIQIPEDVGCLTCLEELDLSGNDFENLPASINQLSRLTSLGLCYCRRLESLPELQHGLMYLDAHDCTSLRKMPSDLEFLTGGYDGMYMFSNCFKLDEQLCFNTLATATLRFQDKVKERMRERTHAFICLPGGKLPNWFANQSRGSSITFQLPLDWYCGGFTGFAMCIAVAFTDYFSDTSLLILCDYSFNTEGDKFLEGRTFFSQWRGFEVEERSISSKSWPRSKGQHRYLGSDHMFFLYDNSIYYEAVEDDTNAICNTVTFKFSVLDDMFEPLDCCKVKTCGCYLVPSVSVVQP